MKLIQLLTIFAYPLSLTAQTQLPVGTISSNQNFAVRNGSSFVDSSLETYEGKILVIMMMTPWCPFCKTNSVAVGDGILDFFKAPGRGTLVGKNAHGIEIKSILLSTEPASNWDTTNTSFAQANAFQQWGLDANRSRLDPRVMLNYYSGLNINSSNLYDWGEDRRRVVVLNLVRNSTSHAFRQIVINQNYFTSSDASSAQSAINAIQNAPATTTFTQWGLNQTLPSGMSEPTADPDGDGVSNLIEFFSGTHPNQAGSRDRGPSLVTDSAEAKLTYRRKKNLAGITLIHQWSTDLRNWQTVPESGLNPVIENLGDIEQFTVIVPRTLDSPCYYRLAITIP